MTHRIVFAPAARDDLLELYDYIAGRGSPNLALGYIQRIEKACASLATFPGRGILRDDLRPGLRVIGFEHRITIAFCVQPGSVAILRILYAGRSLHHAFPPADN